MKVNIQISLDKLIVTPAFKKGNRGSEDSYCSLSILFALLKWGTSWNELEPPENELEPTRMKWNEMRVAKTSTRKSYGS